MRNRNLADSPLDRAGDSEGEHPLELSGDLFFSALRPLTFVAAQLLIALEPLAQILGAGPLLQRLARLSNEPDLSQVAPPRRTPPC